MYAHWHRHRHTTSTQSPECHSSQKTQRECEVPQRRIAIAIDRSREQHALAAQPVLCHPSTLCASLAFCVVDVGTRGAISGHR